MLVVPWLPLLLHANVDLTSRVVSETDLDERIVGLCAKYCQGNRRAGRLRNISISKRDSHSFYVTAHTSLKNHHHQDTLIGGGFAVYEFTIDVRANGVLMLSTCMLTINQITVVNDVTGLLSGLADSQEGKSHRIDNCAHLVRGI